jgi:hypothetical protein
LLKFVVAADQELVGALTAKVIFYFGEGQYFYSVEFEGIGVIFDVRFMEALEDEGYGTEMRVILGLPTETMIFLQKLLTYNRDTPYSHSVDLVPSYFCIPNEEDMMMIHSDEISSLWDFRDWDEDFSGEW